jgi:cyanophycinase
MGVDEDTAAVISRHDDGERTTERLSVLGRGSVTIFDGSQMVTNAHMAKERRPILASGVVLHVLPDGAEFDLTTRELVRGEADIDPGEASDLASANRDLRKMARDIAADDVSPQTLHRRIARRARGAAQ